jgi:osmotically-inducible protein OsmY
MFRLLARLFLVFVILIAIGAFFVGYRWNDAREVDLDRPVATAGREPAVDTERARETGAAIGETVAVGADRAQRAVTNAALTSKIKAKMALDDSIDAAAIDVDTVEGTVTLTGTVGTEAQRTRALQLARETEGVVSVIDRLRVAGR